VKTGKTRIFILPPGGGPIFYAQSQMMDYPQATIEIVTLKIFIVKNCARALRLWIKENFAFGVGT
jgi:hypothetical protein